MTMKSKYYTCMVSHIENHDIDRVLLSIANCNYTCGYGEKQHFIYTNQVISYIIQYTYFMHAYNIII